MLKFKTNMEQDVFEFTFEIVDIHSDKSGLVFAVGPISKQDKELDHVQNNCIGLSGTSE